MLGLRLAPQALPWRIIGGVLLALLAAIAQRCVVAFHRRRARRDRRKAAQRARPRPAAGRLETIFVSVPSYRDPDCARTLLDLFERAAAPERVYVGVCVQNDDSSADACPLGAYAALVAREGTLGDMSPHVRVHRLPASAAQGPMLARSLIERRLYNGERYYMNIDSHTRFVRSWDDECIAALRRCPAPERAVLSAYPGSHAAVAGAQRRGDALPVGTFMRLSGREEDTGHRLPTFEGTTFARRPTRPLPTAFYAGCFAFSRASRLHEVPYDPQCAFVFLGEEFSMAARLYTHGYDLFAPEDALVGHRWDRDYRPTFWERVASPAAEAQRRDGYARLVRLLRQVHPYGLGADRTAAAFERRSGVQLEAPPAPAAGAAWHAFVGVGAPPAPDEATAACGSWRAYERALAEAPTKFGSDK